MDTLYETLEGYFATVIQYLILVIEIIGVLVLLFAIIRALCELIRHKGTVKLDLAEGIGLALEFKMGGELLRTVIARDLEELAVLGAVILLRAAMMFLVQWEIRLEKQSEAPSDAHKTARHTKAEELPKPAEDLSEKL
ncbi:MAG: DUF1622 domain-containing protein [Clostridia bacterium]|nr:DUF1622 domain-containing protein [Clostridia bacterium]